MKGKKALVFSDLGTIIRYLIAFLLLIFVVTVIAKNFIFISDIEKCHLSALAKTHTKVPYVGAENPVFKNLACKTRYVYVKKDGIYINGKRDVKFNRLDAKTDKKIKRALANEMYFCWYQLGEGKLNIFGVKGGQRCVVCSQINFDKTIKEKYPEIKDFALYLNKTKIPEKGISYFSYLTSGQKLTADFAKQKDEIRNIKTDTTSVIFVTAKKSNTSKAIIDILGSTFIRCKVGTAAGGFVGPAGALGGGLVGCAGGLVAGTVLYVKTGKKGKEPYLITTAMFPSEEIGGKCDQLY